jgi:hypothetical protein
MLPEEPQSPGADPGAIAKVEALRREIQQLVVQGIESVRFELTRKCSLASGDKQSQTDFAKTIQGLANAYPPAERIYVIGADQNEKRFVPLENATEFDAANIHQILDKYLEPVPTFEVSVLEGDEGLQFAVIAVAADQARPIVAKVQAGDARAQFLQKGDIWIKKNTSLVRAYRDDLEKMYETRIEAEAERRAERRFADTRNGLEASFRLQFSTERRIPSSDLVFGPEAEYKAYIELLFANQDGLRFHMLLTTLRDLLIESWHSIDAYGTGNRDGPAFGAKVAIHIHTIFQPALKRLLHASLLLIKFDMYPEWFGHTVDLLVEVFAVCGKLSSLEAVATVLRSDEISQSAIATDLLLGGRLLAAYSTKKEHYQYLSPLLRRLVIPISKSTARKRTPFLFWPISRDVPGHDRIAHLWHEVVRPYWLDFFGSERSYLDAACHLEFILHLNSYLATEEPEGNKWVSQYRPDIEFGYWYTSDLWRYSLDPVVPLAEKIYENLAAGPSAAFLLDLSIEHTVFQKVFQPTDLSLTGNERQIFVSYLKKLVEWQARAAHTVNRFPLTTDWGPVLTPQLNGK